MKFSPQPILSRKSWPKLQEKYYFCTAENANSEEASLKVAWYTEHFSLWLLKCSKTHATLHGAKWWIESENFPQKKVSKIIIGHQTHGQNCLNCSFFWRKVTIFVKDIVIMGTFQTFEMFRVTQLYIKRIWYVYLHRWAPDGIVLLRSRSLGHRSKEMTHHYPVCSVCREKIRRMPRQAELGDLQIACDSYQIEIF